MAEIAQLPFAEQQASGLDALSGAAALAANALVDIAQTLKVRPGISAWSGFPMTIPNASPVMGMAALGTSLIYVTSDGRVWACNGAGVVTELSTPIATTKLEGSLRPQLLSLRSQVVIVAGGAPQAADETSSARLGGSPPDSISIAGIATRIVLAPNDTSGTFRWSGLGDSPGHTTWDALEFNEAEAKPDPIAAIATNTNELFAFGTETLQVYSPDPTVSFAAGRTLNIGLLAPHSLVTVDDQFAFLDRERRFVLTDGRSFSDEGSVLSKPIESVLRGIGTVDDCWGFRLRNDRWDAAVWFFPTEGRGFIWNRRSRGWSEWRAWGFGGWQTPAIASAYYWPEANVFLVGLDTGQIAKLDSEATTDLGDPIKVELVTGFVDHGSDNQKKNDLVTLVFRRGATAQVSTAPRVYVSWRNDLGAFCAPSVIDLGRAGDYDPTVELRSLGLYRRRQWKIEYTGDAGFTFIGAREQFQTLEN